MKTNKMWSSKLFSTDELQRLQEIERRGGRDSDESFLLSFVEKFFLLVAEHKDEIDSLRAELQSVEDEADRLERHLARVEA